MSNIGIKRENDRIFKEYNYSEMISETVADFQQPPEISRTHEFRVDENTMDATTIGCILKYAENSKVFLETAEKMYSLHLRKLLINMFLMISV